MSPGTIARLAVPPLCGFAIVAAYVAAEAAGFTGLAAPRAETVAEAAAVGDAARTLQLLAAGQDANRRQTVREGMLDHRRLDLVPLEAAILGRHAELVRLLQRSGAAATNDGRLACFARMRLPEVLADLGASEVESASHDADVEATMKACASEGASSL